MAVRVFEKPKSVQVTVDYRSPSVTRHYSATGSADPTEVLAGVASVAPAFQVVPDVATGQPITLFAKSVTPVEYSPGLWDITVNYSSEAATTFPATGLPGGGSPGGTTTSNAKFDLNFNFGMQMVKTHRAIADVHAVNCVSPVSASVTTAADDATALAALTIAAAAAIDTTAAQAAKTAAFEASAEPFVDPTVSAETLEAANQTQNVIDSMPSAIAAGYACAEAVNSAAVSAQAGDSASAATYAAQAASQVTLIDAIVIAVASFADLARDAANDAYDAWLLNPNEAPPQTDEACLGCWQYNGSGRSARSACAASMIEPLEAVVVLGPSSTGANHEYTS